jgi:hypothetical protein
MAKRKASTTSKIPKRKWSPQVIDSMAEADKADREYWWSRSPAERMRELERLRQENWGYGNGKPTLRMQKGLLRIVDMASGKTIKVIKAANPNRK